MWLLAAEIGASQVVAFVVGSVGSASLILGIVDKRRREVSATWRELAEAKAAKVDDQDHRIAALEAKVELLQSEFVDQLVAAIVSATRSRP